MMFTLKKLLTPFLLPPGLMILIGAAAFMGSLARKNVRAAWACAFLSLMLWASAITPAVDFVVGPLESGLAIPPVPRGDVIIMLGGGVYKGTADLSGVDTPSPDTLERLVTAARLHRRLGLPILVTGGKVHPDGVSSARVARRFLMDLGLAPDKIWTEELSRDTYENALFSASICRKRGVSKPILVTTGTHMKRALFCFKTVGLPATPYPCGLTVQPQRPFEWRQLLPEASRLHAVSKGLHEWIGRLYYWIRY